MVAVLGSCSVDCEATKVLRRAVGQTVTRGHEADYREPDRPNS